jgi:hypothetical protein
VRIGEDDGAHCLRTKLTAPDICIGEEEALQVGESVGAFRVERLARERFSSRAESAR